MREYHPEHSRLPETVYKLVLAIVRDYDRAVKEIKHCKLLGVSAPEGAQDMITAVDQALIIIPDEYRSAVFDNVRYLVPYPVYAGRNTYGRYRTRFLHAVAENLKIIHTDTC